MVGLSFDIGVVVGLVVLVVFEVDGVGVVDVGVVFFGFLFNLMVEKLLSMFLESVSMCNKCSYIEGGGIIKVVEIIFIWVRVVFNYFGWFCRFCNSRGRGYLSWCFFFRFCVYVGVCVVEKDVMMLGNIMMLLEGLILCKVVVLLMLKVCDSCC